MIKETMKVLGIDAPSEDIDTLQNRVSYVLDKKKYNRLVRDIYRENDKNNFYSKVFEVHIAYAIEIAGLKSVYEINVRDGDNSNIDFFVDDDGFSLFIEAKLKQALNTRADIEQQLQIDNTYSLFMNDDEQKSDILRLQSDILSKLQRQDGTRIKFSDPDNISANVIAINVSDLILGMIDPYDCILACCGDSGVSKEHLKKGVVGIFEQRIMTQYSDDQSLVDRFKNAQSCLNGVAFLFRPRFSNEINSDLSYFFVSNRHLTSSKTEMKILSIFDKLFTRYK